MLKADLDILVLSSPSTSCFELHMNHVSKNTVTGVPTAMSTRERWIRAVLQQNYLFLAQKQFELWYIAHVGIWYISLKLQ